MIQISARKEELDRRIAAFIAKKRRDIDDWNIQEFCGRVPIDDADPAWELQDSCARVDAVFVPQAGNRSRIKVSSVVNQWGPQTRKMAIPKRQISGTKLQEMVPHGIEERLKNMEVHLKMKPTDSVYSRLKNLEDRILYLEGVSPDYFKSGILQSDKADANLELKKKYQDWNVQSIERRMQELTETLKSAK